MKVIFKTLKQETHEVEVDSDEITILDLKKAAEEKHKIDANSMKLVFNGTILKDENTLQSYNIKDGNVLVLMISKVKVQNKKETTESTSNNNTTTTTTSNTNTNNNNLSNNTTIKDNNNNTSNTEKSETKKENKPVDYTAQIASLVEMGYQKDYAEAAIKAAKGNVTIAIEYLYNGIPENIPEDNNVSGSDNNTGEVGSEADQVKKIASMVKVLCSNDPTQLQNIILSIQRSQPELLELIKRNEAVFKEAISKPFSDEDMANFRELSSLAGGLGGSGSGTGTGTGSGSGTGTGGRNDVIKLSKTDYDAVQRLKEFGFTEMEAVQAYFACDKNSEMALNFLFETKEGGNFENVGDLSGSNNNNNNIGNNNNDNSNTGSNNNNTTTNNENKDKESTEKKEGEDNVDNEKDKDKDK